MRIIGVTMVKDEADIIGRTLEHLLAEGVDELVVADNMSTDGTSAILATMAERAPVITLADEQVAYVQDQKMTFLANFAAVERGADWIVPFDADELWCGREGTLRDEIERTRAGVLEADTYRHPPVGDPHLRAAEPERSHKVCFRWVEGVYVMMGNHDVEHPGPREAGRVVIHEFQYRSFEQFRRKIRNGAAAYAAATELDPTWGTHWRRLGELDDEGLAREWEQLVATEGLVHDDWEPSA